jgi:hypothetical protein
MQMREVHQVVHSRWNMARRSDANHIPGFKKERLRLRRAEAQIAWPLSSMRRHLFSSRVAIFNSGERKARSTPVVPLTLRNPHHCFLVMLSKCFKHVFGELMFKELSPFYIKLSLNSRNTQCSPQLSSNNGTNPFLLRDYAPPHFPRRYR